MDSVDGTMTTNSPTESALWLASSVGWLDKRARRPASENADLRQLLTRRCIADFLDSFQAALRNVVPRLDQWNRIDPVNHAGVVENSFHRLTCMVALKQYRTIWQRLDPVSCFDHFASQRATDYGAITGNEIRAEDVFDSWETVVSDLASLFYPDNLLNADYLRAGLYTDCWFEKRDAAAVPEDKQLTSKDGPAEIYTWRWDGKLIECDQKTRMEPSAWKLANYLFERKERRVSIADLTSAGALFEHSTDDAVKKAKSRATTWLKKHGIPFQLTTKDGYVWMEASSAPQEI